MTEDQNGDQTDIVETHDTKLAEAIIEALNERQAMVPPSERDERVLRAKADPNFAMRKQMVESQKSDPNGLERIIGASDLTSINFLDRGRRTAEAVCRIKLPVAGGDAFGTGFLVSPGLLMTNNHVIATAAEAAQAEAQFGYEHDLDGVLKTPVSFNLDPSKMFYTSTQLDVTFVAVTPLSDHGFPLERFGWLPLIPMSGKAVDGEWVTIIQHPNGDPKQIAIHANQIMRLDPNIVPVDVKRFIHYSTDTQPGSSGSPVVNDQWQVVAIHHKAVPHPDRGDDKNRWLANEGVRISAIYNMLERQRFENDQARLVLDRLLRGNGFDVSIAQSNSDGINHPGDDGLSEKQSPPFKAAHWAAPGLGYDADFLSAPIPLDPIYADLVSQDIIAPLVDGSGHELKYMHFSSVLHKQRAFPILTVVNIDGNKLIHPGKGGGKWRLDSRIDPQFQPDDRFYVKSLAKEKVFFSRGHLVRRLDPCWGETLEESQRAMNDTFHFTNAAPQEQVYNDNDWGNLEDYVLDKADTNKRRLTVFTGPIFRDNDPLYGKNREGGPWQIPISYWKIAVLQKTDTQISAAAFIVGQLDKVKALYEARVFTGLKPYDIEQIRSAKIQTTIAAVEQETGLNFSALREFDAHGSLESTRQTRWFNRLEDILI